MPFHFCVLENCVGTEIHPILPVPAKKSSHHALLVTCCSTFNERVSQIIPEC